MYSFYKKRRLRNSLRYPGRDYSLPGKYFITICTVNKSEWFGTIINAELQLSEIGSIALKLWSEIPQHFPNITLDEYILMPNHIHGIIIINRHYENPVVGSLHATTLPLPDQSNIKNKTMSSISPKSGSLSVIIRSYKSSVTKYAHKIDIDFSWQSGFYDNIICTTGQLSRIRKYILNNPKNWDNKEAYH
jgi:putative transposase